MGPTVGDPKPAYPRSAASHEVTANNVLELHARNTGWVPSLPVPIDSIVADAYGLRARWEEIPETRDERILGELQPRAGIIALNTRHKDMLAAVVGPLRFTLAHELGHWLYDAWAGVCPVSRDTGHRAGEPAVSGAANLISDCEKGLSTSSTSAQPVRAFAQAR